MLGLARGLMFFAAGFGISFGGVWLATLNFIATVNSWATVVVSSASLIPICQGIMALWKIYSDKQLHKSKIEFEKIRIELDQGKLDLDRGRLQLDKDKFQLEKDKFEWQRTKHSIKSPPKAGMRDAAKIVQPEVLAIERESNLANPVES